MTKTLERFDPGSFGQANAWTSKTGARVARCVHLKNLLSTKRHAPVVEQPYWVSITSCLDGPTEVTSIYW